MSLKKKSTREIKRRNRELVKLLAMGDRNVAELLAENNMPLAIHIASKRGYGFLGIDEITYQGRKAILRAAEKFDPARGADFGTYASFWIRNHLDKAVRQAVQLIRIPAAMSARIHKVRKTFDELGQELEREPTDLEIAARLDLSEFQVRACLAAPSGIVSINAPVTEGGNTVEDLLEDADADPPWAETESALVSELVYRVAKKALTPREELIVRLRYGLKLRDGSREEPMTLEQVSKIVGVTRERVRQLLQQARRKMRSQMELEEQEGPLRNFGTVTA